MGAVSKHMAVGCAITKTHHYMSAFAYAWFKGEFTQLRFGSCVGDTAEFADDPDNGRTELKTGRGNVAMQSDGNKKQLTVNSTTLNIELKFSDESTEILRLCTPAGPAGWSYVQKVAAVDATGTFKAAGSMPALKILRFSLTMITPLVFLEPRLGGTGRVLWAAYQITEPSGLMSLAERTRAAIERMAAGWRVNGLHLGALFSNSITKISNRAGEFMEQTGILSSLFRLVMVTTPMEPLQRCRVTSTSCSGASMVGSAQMRKRSK